MRKLMSLLAVATLASAGPLLAQDVNPAGKYEFTTTVQGQVVGGTMEIRGTSGNWTGVIYAEGQGEIPVSRVTVSGSLITLYAEIPEAGELIVEIEMSGDDFAGTWTLGFDGGELKGRRTAT